MTMQVDGREEDDIREFRLEGMGLMIAGGALIVLLVASFYFGRWYERQTGFPAHSGSPLSPGSDALGNVVDSEEPADVGDKADFFDDLEGEQKQLEPQREARSTQREEAGTPPQPAAAAPGGSFYVQVLAGRDRTSVEKMVEDLRGQGYPVRLFSEKEGRGTLFRVRVGGYPDRAEADKAAEKLRREGHSGAWVTTVD
jgi:hypothetical protein